MMWLRQGESLLRHGDAAGALRAYQQVLAVEPDQPEALHYLGLALLQSGRLPEALPVIARSVLLRPDDPEFHNNYGYACEQAGLLQEARQHYQQAGQLRPRYSDAWYNLGNVLMREGLPEEAEAAFGRATALNPHDGAYWNNFGNARLLQKKYREAEVAYRKALALDETHAEAWNNLGCALRGLARHEESVVAFQRAVAVRPGYAEAWSNLGGAYLATAQLEPGVAAYERFLALNPPDPGPALEALGFALLNLGAVARANTCFSRLMAVSPLLGSAYYGWSRSRHRGEDDREVAEKIERLVASGKVDEEDLDRFYFALGNIYDRLLEPEKAFRFYRLGNDVVRRACRDDPFDGAALERAVSETIAGWGGGFFSARREWGNPSGRPLFIVGMPRSGTTLTEQILSSHPLIAGGGERAFWERREEALKARVPTDWTPAEVATAAQECLADLDAVSSSARHVTDKMPGNFLRLGLIHLVFPHARIIHCRRNPVDTCLSIYFQKFDGYHPYAYDLADLAFYYRQYRRLMAHWREVLPAEVFLEVDYEALVEDQEGESRRLIEFCGLEWDERCLEFHKTERVVKTASNWQVRQPLYKTSKERWRNYEPWIKPLLALLEREDMNDGA